LVRDELQDVGSVDGNIDIVNDNGYADSGSGDGDVQFSKADRHLIDTLTSTLNDRLTTAVQMCDSLREHPNYQVVDKDVLSEKTMALFEEDRSLSEALDRRYEDIVLVASRLQALNRSLFLNARPVNATPESDDMTVL
jgi:hypothetical protein